MSQNQGQANLLENTLLEGVRNATEKPSEVFSKMIADNPRLKLAKEKEEGGGEVSHGMLKRTLGLICYIYESGFAEPGMVWGDYNWGDEEVMKEIRVGLLSGRFSKNADEKAFLAIVLLEYAVLSDEGRKSFKRLCGAFFPRPSHL